MPKCVAVLCRPAGQVGSGGTTGSNIFPIRLIPRIRNLFSSARPAIRCGGVSGDHRLFPLYFPFIMD